MQNNELPGANQGANQDANQIAGSTGPDAVIEIANTLSGVDLSHFNGQVNFDQLKAAGAQFVYLKASEGGTLPDATFATNRFGVKKIGLPCGAYHFFRPKTSVAAQVDNFCKAVGRLQAGDLPPALDIEVPAQWKGIPRARQVKMILDWLTAVEKRLGVQPIIYIGNDMATELAFDPALKKYVLWLAFYTSSTAAKVPLPWTAWTFWQYSETGKVKGVPGNCDLDRFAGSPADLQKLLVTSSQLPLTHRIINWMTGILPG